MAVEYTEMFSTPEEVADHCMLPYEERMRREAEWLVSRNKATWSCDLRKKRERESAE